MIEYYQSKGYICIESEHARAQVRLLNPSDYTAYIAGNKRVTWVTVEGYRIVLHADLGTHIPHMQELARWFLVNRIQNPELKHIYEKYRIRVY